MLYGVTKGDLQMSGNLNKYIDMCLRCGKCKEFCPADIDVCEILSAAKYEYMKNRPVGKIINLLQSKSVFDNFINCTEKISAPYRPVKKSFDKSAVTVVWFKGCVNKILPDTDKYLAKIFKNEPVNIIEPDFKCCGLPFLSEGNLERFFDVMEHNLNELQKYQYDYIITDCASCGGMLASYNSYSNNEAVIKNNINWGDLIADKNIKFKFKKNVRVTFHKPCHLNNDKFFEKIMTNCQNIEYVKMNNYDACCGFSGSFAVKNRDLSRELLKLKINNIKETEADYVITTCPACLFGLKYGLRGFKTKAVSLLEFLAAAAE